MSLVSDDARSPFALGGPVPLVRAGQGKTCSPACYRARRAQVLLEHQPARTAPDAWRERTRLSARSQWRRSPRYQRISAARLELSPSGVKQQLHRALADLLGSEVVHAAGDRGGTTPDRCAVCRGVREQGVLAGAEQPT